MVPPSGPSKTWEDLTPAVRNAVLALVQGPCSSYIKVSQTLPLPLTELLCLRHARAYLEHLISSCQEHIVML